MATATSEIPQKQPAVLGILFFAEMWERFSFYGMRALLVWYCATRLFSHMPDPDATAYGIYGAYGALVYATPFIGGLLADRILGYKRAVMLGAVLMATGHAVMTVENEFCLYLALAFLIVGNGFFKPNISSMVGGLYGENDPRRDRGFTIFYMGINLGAFFQFVPAALGERVSTSIGFGIAGIGMLLGLFVFWRGKSKLGANGEPPDLAKLQRRFGPLTLEQLIYVKAFASVALFALMVKNYGVMGYVLVPFSTMGFLIVLGYALRAEKVVRERLFVVLVLTLFNIIFWAFFEQAGSSINLFTFRNVDRSVFGWQVPATVFQSVNPALIVFLAPLFTVIWARLNKRGLEPSVPAKFALGLMQLGVGFLVLAVGAYLVSAREVPIFIEEESREVVMLAAVVPLFILFFGYLFHTTGELCLSPIGLSMVTKLAPKEIGAMVMGLWFLSTSLSHHFGGIIATLTSRGAGTDIPAGQAALAAGLLDATDGLDPVLIASYDQLASYVTVFQPIGYVSIASGVVLLAIAPVLRKWMHGVK